VMVMWKASLLLCSGARTVHSTTPHARPPILLPLLAITCSPHACALTCSFTNTHAPLSPPPHVLLRLSQVWEGDSSSGSDGGVEGPLLPPSGSRIHTLADDDRSASASSLASIGPVSRYGTAVVLAVVNMYYFYRYNCRYTLTHSLALPHHPVTSHSHIGTLSLSLPLPHFHTLQTRGF
jgi:hypothetical protein